MQNASAPDGKKKPTNILRRHLTKMCWSKPRGRSLAPYNEGILDTAQLRSSLPSRHLLVNQLDFRFSNGNIFCSGCCCVLSPHGCSSRLGCDHLTHISTTGDWFFAFGIWARQEGNVWILQGLQTFLCFFEICAIGVRKPYADRKQKTASKHARDTAAGICEE